MDGGCTRAQQTLLDGHPHRRGTASKRNRNSECTGQKLPEWTEGSICSSWWISNSNKLQQSAPHSSVGRQTDLELAPHRPTPRLKGGSSLHVSCMLHCLTFYFNTWYSSGQ